MNLDASINDGVQVIGKIPVLSNERVSRAINHTMPSNPLALAKKKFEAKEGEIKGGAWKSHVTTEDGDWKSFDEWAAHYEPPKEKKEKKPDSERKKKAKAKFQAKLKETILIKVHDGVANKIMLIMLEVASKVLTKAQEESSKLASSATQLSEIVSRLLNACNGIVLTFRFDTKNKAAAKRKFAYLRREASNRLTDIFYGIATTARGEAQNLQFSLQQLQGEVQEILETKQHFVIAEVSQRLDELLSMGVAKLEEKVETKLDQAGAKLSDLEVKADAVLGALPDLEVNADAVWGSAGVPKPDLDAVAATVRTNTDAVVATVRSSIPPKQDMKDQRDELLSHFGGMVKDMIASKMEKLTTILLEMLDELCRVFGKALDKADKAKKEKDQTQEEMFGEVERSYVKMTNSVSDEVQKVIDMLGGMMTAPKEDEEDEEEDEDEE